MKCAALKKAEDTRVVETSSEPLRILYLEDDRLYPSLAREMLAEDGVACCVEQVETEADFVAALDRHACDLVLADFTLPKFDGMTALALTRERFSDLPFIFVTGTMGEETAVEALKSGATDYVVKNRLSRLAPAVRRALREVGERAERARAEVALKRSEERYRGLVDNMAIGISLISPHMEILSLNRQMREWFPHIDVTQSPICHQSFYAPSADGVCDCCPVVSTFMDGQIHETVTNTPQGNTTRNYKITAFPLRNDAGTITGVIEKVEDVTEQRQAEEEQLRSNELFRALFEASPLATYALDPDGTVRLWNRAAEKTYGWTEQEAVGSFLPFVPEDCREESRQLRERIVGGETLTGVQLRRLRKDGVPIIVDLYGAPVYDCRGEVTAIMAMNHDITEQKQFERDLVQSEQRFRAAFEDAVIGKCLTGTEGRFLMVNRSLCAMLGHSAAELDTMEFLDVVAREDAEQYRRWTGAMLGAKQSSSSIELRLLHKSGRIVWGQLSNSLVRDLDGRPLYFISQIHDVTEQKNLENQLRHAQKMEAIGTLAGGVAHDFNNILTAIIGYGGLMDMKLDRDDPLRPFVEQILTAADRAAGLTQSLLAFGRKQAIEPRPVNPNDIVQGVEKLLLRLLREDIDLRLTCCEGPVTVLADKGQIEQVLMNLATNARDAMPHGGVLALRTEMAEIEREFVSTHGYGNPGVYLLITVSDTGVGMDEATRQRIFEPFFTTKEVGKGTGLGLSMAYGIVKGHNGFITCRSEPGRGTTFRIYLPVIDVLPDRVVEKSAELPPGGTETILLAEDDEQVRTLTRKLLEKFGYRVIEARDGHDAVVQFLAHGGEIGLALLDAIMPGRNGWNVYEEMKKLAPGLKAIFTSGYSADIFQREVFNEPDIVFMSKPTPHAELLKTIRKLLDQSETRTMERRHE